MPPEPPTPHAFISYVREDSALVDELERAFTEAGIPVWRDVRSIFPGDAWKQKIREAIQGDALAFIPVFSNNSAARSKTQMWEEVRWSIDEYRKMPPDSPWIFSVRLDDVALPKFDISSNESLSDLNWTDFFGPRKVSDAIRLVSRIKSLIGPEETEVAARSVVAASATDATRGALLAAAVTDGLSNATRAASARRLLIDESKRVIEAMNDPDLFPMTWPEGSATAAILERTEKLSKLVSPLLEAVMELGANGQSEDGPIATQIVSALAREGFADVKGDNFGAYGRLRKLPALCVLFAGSLGATSTRNDRMLQAFADAPRVRVFDQTVPVTSVLSPWDPFGPSWEVAQFINAAQDGGDVTDDILARYDAGHVYRSDSASASAIVSRVLEPAGHGFAIGVPEYDELFEETEVLIGALANHRLLAAGQTSHGTVENWIGSHTRAARRRQGSKVPEALMEDLEANLENWWPLRGGTLFGGDYRSAMFCLADYIEMVEKARNGRG